jgi:hypothetical protein
MAATDSQQLIHHTNGAFRALESAAFSLSSARTYSNPADLISAADLLHASIQSLAQAIAIIADRFDKEDANKAS